MLIYLVETPLLSRSQALIPRFSEVAHIVIPAFSFDYTQASQYTWIYTVLSKISREIFANPGHIAHLEITAMVT